MRAATAGPLILALVLGALGATDAAAPSLAGHWEGAATHEGKTFRLALDAGVRDGRVVVFVDYVDFALYSIPFEATVEGGAVRLERRPPTGPVTTFAGRISGRTLSGTFSGAGAKDAREDQIRVLGRDRLDEDLRLALQREAGQRQRLPGLPAVARVRDADPRVTAGDQRPVHVRDGDAVRGVLIDDDRRLLLHVRVGR